LVSVITFYLNQFYLKVAVTEGYESVIVAVSELSLSLQDVINKDAMTNSNEESLFINNRLNSKKESLIRLSLKPR
jgi:hypothetical protein